MYEDNTSVISNVEYSLQVCKYSIRCRCGAPSAPGLYMVRRYSCWSMASFDDDMATQRFREPEMIPEEEREEGRDKRTERG